MNVTKKKRKDKVLYLGLDPSHHYEEGGIFHHPVIEIHPLLDVIDIPEETTHIILTSKTAAQLFLDRLKKWPYFSPRIIAIGRITAQTIENRGYTVFLRAREETQEGIIDILETQDLSEAHIFFPHSSLSRPLLNYYFFRKGIKFTDCILYETCARDVPLPDLSLFDKIIFTSPSTVTAFFSLLSTSSLPPGITLQAIGPITQKTLDKYL